jgi:P-type Cu+ transporter
LKSIVRSVVRHSSHPLSAALNDYLGDISFSEPERFDEIPGMGILASLNGNRITIGSCEFVTGRPGSEITTESRVFVGINGQTGGYFSIGNTYRNGLQDVISRLGKKYGLHLISGDNDSERNTLRSIFGPDAQLHFNQSPSDKKEYIEKLRSQGKKVLMIGDGLNDAGALAQSEAGISIADDIFSFSPACDAILESERFGQLDRFLLFTHSCFRVIRINFILSFFYNIIGLSFAVTASLSPLIAAILMPVSSITIVAFATFSVRFLGRKIFPG